jgi:hypothetical protein
MKAIRVSASSIDNPNIAPARHSKPALWKIFWLAYVIPALAWPIALGYSHLSIIFTNTMISIVKATGLPPQKAIWLTVIAPVYCYSLLCWYWVWKYARNTNMVIWGHLAKIVTFIHFLWSAQKAISFWAA